MKMQRGKVGIGLALALALGASVWAVQRDDFEVRFKSIKYERQEDGMRFEGRDNPGTLISHSQGIELRANAVEGFVRSSAGRYRLQSATAKGAVRLFADRGAGASRQTLEAFGDTLTYAAGTQHDEVRLRGSVRVLSDEPGIPRNIALTGEEATLQLAPLASAPAGTSPQSALREATLNRNAKVVVTVQEGNGQKTTTTATAQTLAMKRVGRLTQLTLTGGVKIVSDGLDFREAEASRAVLNVTEGGAVEAAEMEDAVIRFKSKP